MGRAKAVPIGKHSFESKAAATEHIRSLLNTMPWGVPLGGEINEFARALLWRHPGAGEKIGCGVEHIFVDSDNMGKRCFWVRRTDGTKEHFSYISCLDGYDWTKDVRGAMRRAINYQITRFRDAHLNAESVCILTGAKITRDNCHVDHEDPTFHTLHTSWLDLRHFTYEDIRLTDGTGSQIGREMSDPQQHADWCEFHANHARLRLLTRQGNLTRPKKAPAGARASGLTTSSSQSSSC